MEEKSASDRHIEIITSLEKEWKKTSLQFAKDRAALISSYGGKIPDEVEKQLAKKEAEAIQDINKRLREQSDRLVNQPPLEKTADGIPITPLYSKFIADHKLDKSKEPPSPTKDKNEERER